MGWYLRKSLRLGPVRFNLSRSGIGTSIGVKGLRVGTGPKGPYLHAGRDGLYCREQLGQSPHEIPEEEEAKAVALARTVKGVADVKSTLQIQP